ncbi:Alpha-soluble NSF attachment protein [Oopsacas minuta]|uniref:Alpha-soluble NSF attachment protein n=1 Tax=Oopsacas minuta TaxID=111878 RepID=A0AAV7JN50_9METZ|nr:Alpha-soluble NSF attachment protein [Oopsacas minuta]
MATEDTSPEEVLPPGELEKRLRDPHYNNPTPDPIAQKLVIEADGKLVSSKTFIGKLFGGVQKVEEAAEAFHRAGNLFKVNKNWELAGDAFTRASEVQSQLDSRHETATTLIDAAVCYKKCNLAKAADSYSKSSEIYLEMGRFNMSAKYNIALAEVLESMNDISASIDKYLKAGDMYAAEDSNSACSKALLKSASLYAKLCRWNEAIQLYDRVIESSLKTRLLSYSVKEYMFRSLLCQILLKRGEVASKIDTYVQLHPPFQDTRELKLITDVITAVEEGESEQLNEFFDEYDRISRFDAWYKFVIGQIRQLSLDPQGDADQKTDLDDLNKDSDLSDLK